MSNIFSILSSNFLPKEKKWQHRCFTSSLKCLSCKYLLFHLCCVEQKKPHQFSFTAKLCLCLPSFPNSPLYHFLSPFVLLHHKVIPLHATFLLFSSFFSSQSSSSFGSRWYCKTGLEKKVQTYPTRWNLPS